MVRQERGITTLDFVAVCMVLAVVFLGFLAVRSSRSTAIRLDTPYSAVLLNNNSVYFGKLEGLGTPYPVLTDVYYVQSSVNQETKAVSNILVKRGREWHSPDRMIINASDIVFVEPVGQNSKVAQLIADSKK